MVPVLKDPAKEIKDHAYGCFPKGQYMGRTIRTNQYRMVEWSKMKDEGNNNEKIYELYDYINDPLETKNIASDNKKVLNSMIKILASYPEPVIR